MVSRCPLVVDDFPATTIRVDAHEEAWQSNVVFLSIIEQRCAVGPPTVQMEEGLHTWPKEKRSWRGFCHDWLASDSQKSGLVEEVEVDHVAIKKQVRIKEEEKQVRIVEAPDPNQKVTGPQRVDLYIDYLAISWLELHFAILC